MTVMPCSDGHTCDEDNQSISLEHSHTEDEKDHCSPFCVCSCCGMKMNIESITRFYKLIVYLNSKCEFNYSFLYYFSFNKAVWHPPTFC